jgi:hypothetical protein
MERDPRSNREAVPPARPQQAVAGGPTPSLAPTSGAAPLPRRRPRRTGLNPWYFVLIGGIPILVLAVMLLAVGGGWPPPGMAIRVPTPSPVWEAYAAFFGQDQLDQIKLDKGTAERDPGAGPGWYIIHSNISNNSGFDLNNIDVRAFFYDSNQQLIGGGVANVGALKNGESKAFDVQAQLTNGPVPRSVETPSPSPPDTFADYALKIVAILPAPTPTR